MLRLGRRHIMPSFWGRVAAFFLSASPLLYPLVSPARAKVEQHDFRDQKSKSRAGYDKGSPPLPREPPANRSQKKFSRSNRARPARPPLRPAYPLDCPASVAWIAPGVHGADDPGLCQAHSRVEAGRDQGRQSGEASLRKAVRGVVAAKGRTPYFRIVGPLYLQSLFCWRTD